MNIKAQHILYFIITVIMVGGCYPSPPTTNQTASPYAFASPMSEALLPTVILTATRLPGLTPPPRREDPKLITPRVTPFPTRTRAEAREDLEYMLQTNGNCALPCFWGIHPDMTQYEELYSVIDHLGGYRFEALQSNGHLLIGSSFKFEEESGIFVEFAADLQDDIVKDLKVLLLNLRDTGLTPADWSAYNMNEILGTYGVPDKVELYYSGPYNSLSFHIRLKYESIDTAITYSGLTMELDKYLTPTSAVFCPEEIGIESVELHMGKHPFNAARDGVPLSKATGLNEQDFYKLFTENPSACLTLDRKAFYP